MKTMMKNEYQPDYVSPPGETLLETLEMLGISQAELALRAGRPKKTINEIIQGKVAITPETALQLERVLSIPASFWNKREYQYREFLARQEDKKHLEKWIPWLNEFPVEAMIQEGWVQERAYQAEQVHEVLKFFGVASPEAWRATWEQKIALFHKKPAFAQSSLGTLSAWLRQGEREAEQVDTLPYDAMRLHQILDEIGWLARRRHEGFEAELARLCAKAGVAVVFAPELPTIGRCSVAWRISTSKALIQLSLSYKLEQQFWFLFFHGVGHLLLHGRREAFLDCTEEPGGQEQEAETIAKEQEADSFARKRLEELLAH